MAKKILIIDDDKIFSKILRDGLVAGGQGGYEVFAAFDGAQGFEIAEREKPNLIMLDLVMPDMGGIDFLKKLRAEDWGIDIPVIVETQLPDMKEISQGVELGVHGYFIKSDYSIDAILRQVGDVFK